MAKPILIMRLPHDYANSFNKIQKSVRQGFNDEYHVLVIAQETEEPKFEVFNVDKETPINYSELKKLINKEVELKVVE